MKRSRGLRLIKNITSSFVVRFGNLLAMAVMIPIAVNGLDNTNYSTFAVLISLSLAFTYADFGIGSAVVNSIGKDTDSRVAIVLSTATSILIMVAFISLIVMTVLYTMGVQNSDTYLALFLMAINLPFAIVHKVLLGDGRKYFSDMCMLLAKIIGLLGVFLSAKNNMDLEWYLVSFFGSTFLINICAYIFFVFFDPKYRFSIDLIDNESVFPLLQAGAAFLSIQVAFYFVYSGDVVFLNGNFSADFVTAYDVCIRLFGYVPALVSIAIIPVWPSFNEAIRSGDLKWMKKVYLWMTTGVVLISMVSSVLIVVFLESIQEIWLGRTFDGPSLLVRQMIGGTMILLALGSAQSMLMNSYGLIIYQAKVSIVFIVFIVFGKAYFSFNGDIEMFVIVGFVCTLMRVLAQLVGTMKAKNIIGKL